jgi:L-seryl-tRNA(Ser) seleniumtransferase
MRVTSTKGIYEDLGVRRVINGMGSMTLLGGSMLSPGVMAAMAEANDAYVDMADLLEQSGRAIAQALGAEAALVTSGCFAALAQGAAAIMTGADAGRIAGLPHAHAVVPRYEFLIQKPTRYHYDRAVAVAGGVLVEVGDQRRTTAQQLQEAIGPRTAGVLYPAKFEGSDGVLSVPEVVRVARQRDVAVLVDAAAEVYPLERMTWLCAASGADLVCFGAKYLGSANSTGFMCGRKTLVEAAALNGFIAYETHDNQAFGRGYKLDRQEIVGTVVAVREWLAADHRRRFAAQEQRLATIAGALAGLPGVATERLWPRQGPWMQLKITVDASRAGTTAAAVQQTLRDGDPSVRVRLEDGDLLVYAHGLNDGEDEVVADSLRRALTT